jgi:hypothetical protein
MRRQKRGIRLCAREAEIMSLFRTQLKQRIARLEAAAAARLARASGRRLLTARPRHFATSWPNGERIECGSPRAEAWLAEQRAAGVDLPERPVW